MRLAALLSVFALLGLLAGPTLADKIPEGKEWHYDLSGRDVVPEVEPNDTCPGQTIACGDVVDPASLEPDSDVDWYAIYLEEGSLLTVGTDAGLPPDCCDTQLYLYDTDCLTQLAFDDDSGPGFFSLIENWRVPAAGTYHIKVIPYPYATPYTGSYILMAYCIGSIPPPVNDLCEGAIELPRCSFGQMPVNLSYASNDYDPGIPGPSCTGYGAPGPDLTFVMQLGEYDIVNLTYDDPDGSTDLSLYIVSDCSDPSGSCLIGADDGNPEQILNWYPQEAGTYYVIADAYSPLASGDMTLDYEIACLGACCIGFECYLTTETECAELGGLFVGIGVPCDPWPCGPTPAARTTWGQIKSVFR